MPGAQDAAISCSNAVLAVVAEGRLLEADGASLRRLRGIRLGDGGGAKNAVRDCWALVALRRNWPEAPSFISGAVSPSPRSRPGSTSSADAPPDAVSQTAAVSSQVSTTIGEAMSSTIVNTTAVSRVHSPTNLE